MRVALILAKRDYGTRLGASEYLFPLRLVHSQFSLVASELAQFLAMRDYPRDFGRGHDHGPPYIYFKRCLSDRRDF